MATATTATTSTTTTTSTTSTATYYYYPPHYGWITGTSGDDTLYGTERGRPYGGDYRTGNDLIAGLGGNDKLYGLSGDDLLDGGRGNDLLDGGSGIDTASYLHVGYGIVANLEFGTARAQGGNAIEYDTLVSIENLWGSAYNDYFQGSEVANYLEGNYGDDVLFGWGGNDKLDGGAGRDYVFGGDGDDTIIGGTGNDYLDGDGGIDTVDYSYSYEAMRVSLAQGLAHTRAYEHADADDLTEIENVIGTAYGDVIEGDDVRNELHGGAGNDLLIGNGGNDALFGGEGDDTMVGGAGGDAFLGGAGTDTVDYSGAASAVAFNLQNGAGYTGEATLDSFFDIENAIGSAFGDDIGGTEVANILEGRGGDDLIRAGGGDDVVFGGEGRDRLEGGAGRDVLVGGLGADSMDGGEGQDVASYEGSAAAVTIDLLRGTGRGGDAEGDRLTTIEDAVGSAFGDTLLGNNDANELAGRAGGDRLFGYGGDDLLIGDEGNDSIDGGAGADRIIGGAGRDVLVGGLDRDTFVFQFTSDSAPGAARDLIRDFVKGMDKIDLSAIDAHQWFQGDQAFTYIGQDAFTKPDPASFGWGSAGQLRSVYVSGNTLIEGDVNGDARADFQILLAGQINLSVLDFVL